MARRHWMTLLKLVLMLGLMALVFSNVQWDDALIERSPSGEEREIAGEILGRWDTPTVRFQREDETGAPIGEPIEVRPGEGPDGGSTVVSPGFGTYVIGLDVPLFLGGALCYFVSVLFASTRWWWLMRVNALRVTWWESVRFTWIGLFFNNVLPGQTGGDVVKALYIMKHCDGARMPALISVLVDRVLGLASLALLGGIVVLFALDAPDFGVLAASIWGVLGGVALLGVVAFSKRLRRLVQLDDLLGKLPETLSGLLRKVDQAIYFYRGHKGGISVWLALGMVNHAVSVLAVMLIGMAIGVGMPPFEYFVLVPVITIASALPVAPNGWGVGEFLFREMFGRFGAPYLEGAGASAAFIMGTRGVALSVVYRIHLTLWSLAGGLLVLFEKDRVTRADVEEEIALEATE